ncbi:MAG TPA: shikimate kinase [Azospirillaceae bacterium]|nr:shikimate kinase [Azospirillaceae bacterium]
MTTSTTAATLPRTVVLVGLMGAGKSSIGRRLAARLGVAFKDADVEIESAAGMTIEEIFAKHGEAHFRLGERRVIQRLVEEPEVHGPLILATGGGAFMDPETRGLIRAHAVSVWLRADLEVLLTRTARKNNRPLLKKGDPREILSKLIEVRYPVYAEADITVDSDDGLPEETVHRVLVALERHLGVTLGEGKVGKASS